MSTVGHSSQLSSSKQQNVVLGKEMNMLSRDEYCVNDDKLSEFIWKTIDFISYNFLSNALGKKNKDRK
jgi:hypothetical protein